MASKGRNGDSMLVHMTPGEVAGLHALALKHGGSLTVNPDTGLPEANFLKSLLPMIAGFALGPAGFGLVSSGLAAGAVVGGVTGLATGSLSKGLMAGLGAYGGFGIGESLSGLGAAELAKERIGEQIPTYMGDPAAYTNEVNAVRDRYLDAANTKVFSPMDKLSAGFSSATASPTDALNFAKNNFGSIAAAASPIMADMMVPTTTQMPTAQNPGYIRQKVFDPGTQTYRSLAPVAANEWKDRSFSDIYRGYNGGGIVALAGGGDAAVAAYQAGNYGEASRLLGESGMSAQDVVSKYGLSQADAATVAKNLGYAGDMSGLTYAAPVTQAAAAAPTYTQYTPEQIGSYLTTNPNADIAAATRTTNADPNAVNQYIANLTSGYTDPTATKGGSGTAGFYNTLTTQGIDPNEYYAAITAIDPNYATQGFSKADIAEQYDIHRGANALTAQIAKDKIAADPVLGYDKQWVKFMDDNNYSVLDAARAFGLSTDEVQRRYNAVKAAEKVIPKNTVVGGTGNDVINNTFDSSTEVARNVTNPYGNATNPGDLTFNPDGTITVQPNIPYRPAGGFPDIGSVKNAWTAGGGSLGYVSPVVTSADQHDELYNRFTPGGDSEAAYNYLIGKGGAKYPTKSRVGEIARPYREATMGYPASTNKAYNYDAATGKMVRNPDYVAPGRDAAGNVNYTLSLNEMKKYLTANPLSGQALYEWAQENGASAQDVADATGRKLSEVYAEFRDASKKAAEAKKVTPTADAAVVDSSYQPSGGGGEAAGGLQQSYAMGGYAVGGGLGTLGGYSDGGRLLKGPGDGVSDSIPATIGAKQQPARLADGEFVVPARIVSELGNGSTDAGAKKLYAMMDRVQRARGKTTGKNKVAANSRADKYLPA